jgi:hypothetical protein
LNINDSHAQSQKQGILLVAFGTSVSKAQISYQNIEKRVRAAFPVTKTSKSGLERLFQTSRSAGPIPPILSAKNWPSRAS